MWRAMSPPPYSDSPRTMSSMSAASMPERATASPTYDIVGEAERGEVQRRRQGDRRAGPRSALTRRGNRAGSAARDRSAWSRVYHRACARTCSGSQSCSPARGHSPDPRCPRSSPRPCRSSRSQSPWPHRHPRPHRRSRRPMRRTRTTRPRLLAPAPPSFDPALASAIWPDAPEAVEIAHVVSHRGERVVLYKLPRRDRVARGLAPRRYARP